MRLAFMGTRGIPARYGGFETLAEELGARLAARGHEVTVYCRAPHVDYQDDAYRGVRLVRLPTPRRKHLETIVHTGLSATHGLTQRYDAVLMCIAGNSPLSWIPRLAGQRVILHVDGLDWRRAKWGGFARTYLRWCEALAPLTPNAFITDSTVVSQYYLDRFGRAPDAVIGYGGHMPRVPAGETLARFGLEPRRYFLFVGRLVPDNCVHHLVEASRYLQDGFRCVIVGDASYQDDYIAYLKRIAGPNTVFTGYVFGEGYRELSSHAYAFVEPSEVGGTHPAIVEAMAIGNCVVANGIPENRETIGDAGLFYDGTQGSAALERVLSRLLNVPDEVERFRTLALRRAGASFAWDRIVDEYEALFERVVAGEVRCERREASAPAAPVPRPASCGKVFPPATVAVGSRTRDRRG